MKFTPIALLIVTSLFVTDSNAQPCRARMRGKCAPKQYYCVPQQVVPQAEVPAADPNASRIPCPSGAGCPATCRGYSGVGAIRNTAGVNRVTFQFANTQNVPFRIRIAEEIWRDGIMVRRRCLPNAIEIAARSRDPVIYEVYWRSSGPMDGVHLVAYDAEPI